MSQQYPSNWKNCATCVFWTGYRDVDTFGNYIKVDSAQTKGKCMCRGSGWCRTERTAGSTCNSHLKWPVLS